MGESPQEPRDVLGQLAREYNQKFSELEEVLTAAPPDQVPYQLRVRAELSTNRFRAAQLALFELLFGSAGEDNRDQILRAATALCSCFDEMHILFQALLDSCDKPESEAAD